MCIKKFRFNKKQFSKWIVALDSGEYEQGVGRLQDFIGSYCCLGVGCKVLILKPKLTEETTLVGSMPIEQPKAPKWLKGIDDNFFFKTGLHLTELNDEKGFSFAEIATVVELVYIHKILD